MVLRNGDVDVFQSLGGTVPLLRGSVGRHRAHAGDELGRVRGRGEVKEFLCRLGKRVSDQATRIKGRWAEQAPFFTVSSPGATPPTVRVFTVPPAVFGL